MVPPPKSTDPLKYPVATRSPLPSAAKDFTACSLASPKVRDQTCTPVDENLPMKMSRALQVISPPLRPLRLMLPDPFPVIPAAKTLPLRSVATARPVSPRVEVKALAHATLPVTESYFTRKV